MEKDCIKVKEEKKEINPDSAKMVEATAIPDSGVFDENCFTFKLDGGRTHTDILIATATIKNGAMAGTPLPLHCTWYILKENQEMIPISGINGAFYQPTLDDISKKICVNAVPASDAEFYEGMPAFAEIGPIQLDPLIQKQALDILSREQETIPLTIEDDMLFEPQSKINLSETNINASSKLIYKGSFIITKTFLELIYTPEGKNEQVERVIRCKWGGKYPLTEIDPTSNTRLKFIFGEEKMVFIHLKNNIERDVITMVIRINSSKILSSISQNTNTPLLNSQKSNLNNMETTSENILLKSKSEELASQVNLEENKENLNSFGVECLPDNIQHLLQIEELVRENKKIAEEKDKLFVELEKEKTERFLKEEEHKGINVKYQNLTQNYLLVNEENDQKTQKVEELESEFNFLKQDLEIVKKNNLQLIEEINIYKISNEEENINNNISNQAIHSKYANLKEKYKKLKNNILEKEEKKEKDPERSFNERLEEIKIDFDNKWEKTIIDYEEKMEKLKENKESENKYLQKKIESLSQENEKLGKRNATLSSTLSEEKSYKQEVFLLDALIKKIQLENQMILKELEFKNIKNNELVDIITEYKRAFDEENRKSNEYRKIARIIQGNNMTPEERTSEFQTLINSFTGTIAEKEEQLATQKEINKSLMLELHKLKQNIL